MTDAADTPDDETPAETEVVEVSSTEEPVAEPVMADEPLAETPTPPADEPASKEEVMELVKTVVYALLIALVLRVFLFQPFTIPSSSMRPNLLIGDYVIVSKFSYGYSRNSIPFSPPLFKGRLLEGTPKRGDVIVFKTPAEGHKDLIKRLIGLPGDTIQVTNGVLYVNGKALPRIADGLAEGDSAACPNLATPMRFWETNPIGRRYITYDCGRGDLDDTPVFLVPEGNYFFMGDNRNDSEDSRFADVGFVPKQNLVGPATRIWFNWRLPGWPSWRRIGAKII